MAHESIYIYIIYVVVIVIVVLLANMYNCHHLTQPFRLVDMKIVIKPLGHDTPSEKRPKIFYSDLNL